MSRRYRLVDVEEAIAESEDLADVADDIAETDEDIKEHSSIIILIMKKCI